MKEQPISNFRKAPLVSSSLLDQIKAGKSLNHIDISEEELDQRRKGIKMNGLLSCLATSLNLLRVNLREDETDEEDDGSFDN
jgi:hypothetical protein